MKLDRSAELSAAVAEWTSAGRRPPIRACDCECFTPDESLLGRDSYPDDVVAIVVVRDRKEATFGEKQLHADGSFTWHYSTRPVRRPRVTAKVRAELRALLGEVVALDHPGLSERAAKLRGRL